MPIAPLQALLRSPSRNSETLSPRFSLYRALVDPFFEGTLSPKPLNPKPHTVANPLLRTECLPRDTEVGDLHLRG